MMMMMIAQYRWGKVVSAWRMNAISKWRYLLYGSKFLRKGTTSASWSLQ
jgi:hypothetical protein